MRSVWTEHRMVQSWLDFESAVAWAEGELGIISKESAAAITQSCNVEVVTTQQIAQWRERTGHVIVSMVRAFGEVCPKYGEAFHLGPTTQDVLDTGLTLQIRDSLRLLIPSIVSLVDVVCDLASQYRDVPQIGRTEGQHAAPITFGYKLAVLADELGAHLDRLIECSRRLLVLTMFGATGVQSSYVSLAGPSKVQRLIELVAARLTLEVPPVCPHHRTDRFAELGSVLSMMLATLGEAGLEIRDLQRTEVAEVSEPYTPEQHSSSTMPQKRNPEVSEWWEGLAKVGAGHALALAAIRQQHERDITRLAPELVCISNLFLYCSATVDAATMIFKGLEVNVEAMKRNLESAQGMAMAESVMLALFSKSGKKLWAHELCHKLAMASRSNGTSFRSELESNREIAEYLNAAEIDAALASSLYTGTAVSQVEQVVARWGKKKRAAFAAADELHLGHRLDS